MKHAYSGNLRVVLAFVSAAVIAAGATPRVVHAQQAEVIGPTTSFNREIRFSSAFRTALNLDPAVGLHLDFFNYSTSRLHDARHRNSFAEEISGPLTYFRVGGAIQPNQDFTIARRGITLGGEFVKTIGGPWGLGAAASYSRIDVGDDRPLTDIEFGVQGAYWTSRRTFLLTRIGYRRVEPGSRSDGSLDDFVQLRNHLTYVVAEDWSFTYSQEVGVRVGLRASPHTDVLRIDNNFLFSPSSRFSWGVKAGVDLSFFVENNTSLIMIPIGVRAELFPTSAAMVTADALYNLPTMIGQQTGGVSVSGGVGFRF